MVELVWLLRRHFSDGGSMGEETGGTGKVMMKNVGYGGGDPSGVVATKLFSSDGGYG